VSTIEPPRRIERCVSNPWAADAVTALEGARTPQGEDALVQSKRHRKSRPGPPWLPRRLAATVSADEVAVVVRHVCGAKERLPGPSAARRAARRVTAARGQPVWAYRCPFGDDRHWHIDHVPSISFLRRLALVIRARAQGLVSTVTIITFLFVALRLRCALLHGV
jgi:hypothetical protein